MKTKINIDDFILVVSWLKIYNELDGIKFKYHYILDQAETYKITNTEWDTSIHSIDNIMVDIFNVYVKIKDVKKEVEKVLNILSSVFNTENIMNENKKFIEICEDLLINYKYSEPEIKGIQKTFLLLKMSENIKNEDYENAAKIRDIINY